MYDRGILHRDLKPANILVRADGSLILGDFGLSAVYYLPDSNFCFVGSPSYMAPEILNSKCIGIQDKGDVYSLGATAAGI